MCIYIYIYIYVNNTTTTTTTSTTTITTITTTTTTTTTTTIINHINITRNAISMRTGGLLAHGRLPRADARLQDLEGLV